MHSRTIPGLHMLYTDPLHLINTKRGGFTPDKPYQVASTPIPRRRGVLTLPARPGIPPMY